METFIRGLPKVELHLHIEGSLEPEALFAMAKRNGVDLPYDSAEEVRRAYQFTDLQSFLDIYYRGAAVLQTDRDFHDLMWAYLQRAAAENVRHAEIFFDPQTHTERGVSFETLMSGFAAARAEAKDGLGISTLLIMCFLRHLPEEAALATLDQAMPFRDQIVAVGLDSSERGNPPSKFRRVFEQARAAGMRAVAHAGEEGPPDYITDSLDLLHAERIDHGVACETDPVLVERLVSERITLTMCPLSNVKLRVFDTIGDHNLKRLLDRGVRVTINSDDPAYFGGYVTDNYLAVQHGLGMDRMDLVRVTRHAIEGSFADDRRKAELLAELAAYHSGTDQRP